MASKPLRGGLVRLSRMNQSEARCEQDRLYIQRADYWLMGNMEV